MPHTHKREEEGLERLFIAVFTIGVSELANAHIFTCTKCDTKIIKES